MLQLTPSLELFTSRKMTKLSLTLFLLLVVPSLSGGVDFPPHWFISGTDTDSIYTDYQEKERSLNGDMVQYFKKWRISSLSKKASTIFMIKLFHFLQGGFPIVKATGVSQKMTDLKLSDTIRSFSAQELSGLEGLVGEIDVRFKIPYLPHNEKLRLAEIRFSRSRGKPLENMKARRYKIKLHVLKGGKLVGKHALRTTPLVQSEYDVFDVSRALSPWINGYHGNVTISVKLPVRYVNSLSRGKLERSESLIVFYSEDNEFLEKMYKSYTSDDQKAGGDIDASRARRSLPNASSVEDARMDYSRPTRSARASEMWHNSRKPRSTRQSRNPRGKGRRRKHRKWSKSDRKHGCHLYDFDVDFNTIGWGQWIIHPKRFNAKVCYGSCPSPIDIRYKPTNHAMLQSLMKTKRTNAAPSPCCVPTKLKSLSMLYFEYDEIVVRHHENMLATECGCR